jgi:putative peptidoglycan lipid II flippase
LNEAVKEAPHGGRSMLRAASLISGLTMLSRLLGLAREQVFAALLGAGLQADAFQIAYRIPNLLRDLFAEGALSAAFVPTYAAALVQEGRARAFQLAARLVCLLSVGLASVILLGYLATGPLVDVLAPGYGQIPGKQELTEHLTRVMLPFLPLVSFAAVAMGMLNAEERYTAPALAPSMFNVVAIVVGLGLAATGAPPERAVLGWAVGTVLGGLAQLVVQLPPLWRSGFRPSWSWLPRDPGILRIAALMAPATLGLAAVELNLLINSRFASQEPGAVSWLTFAFRILYLPIGIFGVAIGTIATTGLARSAARGDRAAMAATLVRGLKLLLFLCIPAALGLIAVGRPIVRLIYERGRFTPADTVGTAAALAFYAVGLVAYTGVKVVAPAFYALERARVPLLGSALAVATNLLTILSLHPLLGFRAVALGTSLGSIVQVAVLLIVFERDIGGLRGHGLLASCARMLAASLPMAAAAFASARWLEWELGTGTLARLAVGLAPVAVGIAVYALACRLLRVHELQELLAALRRQA